jgi:hypothetical protein
MIYPVDWMTRPSLYTNCASLNNCITECTYFEYNTLFITFFFGIPTLAASGAKHKNNNTNQEVYQLPVLYMWLDTASGNYNVYRSPKLVRGNHFKLGVLITTRYWWENTRIRCIHIIIVKQLTYVSFTTTSKLL